MLMHNVASADVGDVAKSTGSDVAKILFITLIFIEGNDIFFSKQSESDCIFVLSKTLLIS